MGWSVTHSLDDRCQRPHQKRRKKRFRKGHREISLLFVGSVKNNGQCACLTKSSVCGGGMTLRCAGGGGGRRFDGEEGRYLFSSHSSCVQVTKKERVACYAFFFILIHQPIIDRRDGLAISLLQDIPVHSFLSLDKVGPCSLQLPMLVLNSVELIYNNNDRTNGARSIRNGNG